MYKDEICKTIDNQKEVLLKLSHDIHEHPEIRFTEKTAVKLIKEVLVKNGFEFICPWAGLDTAFKAIYHGKPGGPTLAFVAEYDALEEVGHGCGHNLIATMAVGGALGLKSQIKDLTGDIVVMGCPGEEGGKGKVIMLNNHGFDGIDYAMMIHPAEYNMIQRGGLAALILDVEFFGKPAHSAKPTEGINALAAMIQLFNGIDAKRPTWPNAARCNGIITKGGSAPNIIPDYASAQFTVRATVVSELKKMIKDIENIAEGAALMLGAKVKCTEGLISTERYSNLAMEKTLQSHMKDFGINMVYPPAGMPVGSSDFGNVTLALPGIHSYLSIAPEGEKLTGHTPEFTAAAISPRADRVMMLGAKGLALTGYDVLTKPELRKEIATEFAKLPKE